jgi:hypothetical protein
MVRELNLVTQDTDLSSRLAAAIPAASRSEPDISNGRRRAQDRTMSQVSPPTQIGGGLRGIVSMAEPLILCWIQVPCSRTSPDRSRAYG